MTEPLSDEEQRARRLAVRDIMPSTPFLSGLGIVFDRYEPDDVVLRLPFRDDLTNDGTYFHGGVIASVIDTAGAAAAWSNHDFDKGARASTIAMTVQYVGAAKRSDLLCRATTVKRGRGTHLHRDHRHRRRRRRRGPCRADLPHRALSQRGERDLHRRRPATRTPTRRIGGPSPHHRPAPRRYLERARARR